MRLDFDLIGDYREPEPIEVEDRCLRSQDGETLAEICALLDAGDVCFISVLEDGTCVDTCGSENPHPDREFEAADQVWVSYLPDVSAEEMYTSHVKTLKDLCARKHTSVLRFKEDQFRAIVTYDQRIHCRWRFRNGFIDQEPPAPEFASLKAMPDVPLDDAKQVAART